VHNKYCKQANKNKKTLTGGIYDTFAACLHRTRLKQQQQQQQQQQQLALRGQNLMLFFFFLYILGDKVLNLILI